MRIQIFGEKIDTGIQWTGSVWQRPDNGARYASSARALREWIEDYIRAGGEDPEDYEAEIGPAIESATDRRQAAPAK